MIKQEFRGASGILLPGAITIPKGEEIAISQDWLIFPEAITGEGKVWTIDGRLEPIQKQDNEMWICTYQDQEFKEPLQYKTKNDYNWHVVEVSCENELDYVDKTNIKHLIISNNLKTIKDEEFLDCYALKTIKIPDSVTYIGNMAFYDCYELHDIAIPDSVTDIGGGVFSYCNTLKSVTLPNTLKELKLCHILCDGNICGEVGFFHGCTALEHIKLPDNLITLGTYAFSDCYSLKDIVFPNTLETIEQQAFEACGIESIIIPNSVTSIGNQAFRSCHALRNVILSENLQIIPEYLFTYCNCLTSIVIPDKVTEINNYAFMDTGLQKLTIGKNVNYIGESVFWNTHLCTITSYAITPPQIQWNTFDNVDRGLTLIVPDPELYRNAEYWNEFYNIYTINPYEVNITSANEDWGTVAVDFNSLEEVYINAIAKEGFKFKQWSDGVTESWRSISPTGDINLVAEFEKIYIPSIAHMNIISSTPTSITMEFEVACNEERQYFNDGYINCYADQYFNQIPISCEFGTQEITIDGLNPDTDYDIVLTIVNNAYAVFSNELSFTTPSIQDLYFSVSDKNKVTLSPGNLQYHPANNEWRFAQSQLDYIGEENSNISYTYNGWLDLFGWGTGDNPIKLSQDINDYQTFVDWGINKIGNDAPNTWRTLTSNEWEYLLNTRTNATSLKGVAQVNGVNGLILLPDNWICPAGVSFKSGFHSDWGVEAYGQYQTFSADQWSKLESAGAVFLPAAGERGGSYVDYVQQGGSYWSTSEYNSNCAENLLLYSNDAYMDAFDRYNGYSVRLVKDLN